MVKEPMRLIPGLAFLTFVLAACTPAMQNRPQIQANRACFSAPASGGDTIPETVLRKAAYITLEQGYTYFRLSKENNVAQQGSRPALHINYGRSPFGFGDPAQANPDGLSAGLFLASPRTQWCLTMATGNQKLTDSHDARTILPDKP